MLPTTLATGAYVTAHAKKELDWTLPIGRGAKKMAARRVQEHLTLAGFGVPIDADFGPATEKRLQDFQRAKGLPASGVVDQATFEKLVEPLVKALQPIPGAGKSLSQLTLQYSLQHTAQHPLEVGGPNSGPWVRTYLGFEGSGALWCAGFVCYALEAAGRTLGIAPPIASSFSCDTLADRAKVAGKFVSGAKIRSGAIPKSKLVGGSFFLVARTSTDFTHVGIVSHADASTFDTVEGNTNSGGSSNGTEATERARGYDGKDFIVW